MTPTSRLRRWTLIALAILIAALVAAPAFAAGKKKSKKSAGIDAALGTIEWRDSPQQVVEKLERSRLEIIGKSKKLRKDPVARQRAEKQVRDWAKTVEKSETRFSGKNSNYDASIVAGHYTLNNGESMLRARDKLAQRYFFFLDGKLYKLVVAYNSDYIKGVDFAKFVGSAARKYGRPASAEVDEYDELVRATWADRTSKLELENMLEYYNTYSMVFSDRVRAKQLTASKRAFGGLGKELDYDESVSDEIAALTTEGADKQNSGVLGSLVGNIDIDSEKGRPKDAPPEADEPTSPTEKAKAKKAKAKKKKSTKKKSRPKGKAKKNFKLDDGDTEFVVY